MSAFRIYENPTHLELEFCLVDSGNAMSLVAARELSKIVKSYRQWKSPVVVTSGHPTLFCSGGNLTDYSNLKNRAAGLKINREITKCLQSFGAWPVVKLAVIEGDVLGGGMEWLGHYDFRWSTNSVFLTFWQRRIGLSPGWGGGTQWSQILGDSQTLKLLLEASLISAPRALDLGLVDRVLSASRIRDAIAPWCEQLKGESMNAIINWSPLRERQIFEKLWLGPEHLAALARWRKR